MLTTEQAVRELREAMDKVLDPDATANELLECKRRSEAVITLLESAQLDHDDLAAKCERLDACCAIRLDLLKEAKDLINEVAAYGNCDCDIPHGETCVPCQCSMLLKRIEEMPPTTCGQPLLDELDRMRLVLTKIKHTIPGDDVQAMASKALNPEAKP